MIFILAAIVGLFLYMSLWYLLAIKENDLSLVDVAYGMAFVMLAFSMFIYSDRVTINYLIVALVSIWGIRLTYTIAKRKIGKPEDWRYSKMKQTWGTKFKSKAYSNIFMLQALLILIISAPIIVVANYQNKLSIVSYIGVLIWIFGFIFEATADYQLKQFLLHNKDKNKVMMNGVWSLSRHPNYFGEVLQWWGLWLIVVCLPYGWLAIISPLTITLLILFVSGVPMLEKKYINNKNYQLYAKKTSIFIPWFPKKG